MPVSSSSSSSGSSSSSSSSSCCANCNVVVTLVPLGTTGCGIEISNGVAYSIGSQFIDVAISDPCGSVVSVLINGNGILPVFVKDGQAIVLTVIFTNDSKLCSAANPKCVLSMFMAQRTSSNKVKITMNNQLRLRRRR